MKFSEPRRLPRSGLVSPGAAFTVGTADDCGASLLTTLRRRYHPHRIFFIAGTSMTGGDGDFVMKVKPTQHHRPQGTAGLGPDKAQEDALPRLPQQEEEVSLRA